MILQALEAQGLRGFATKLMQLMIDEDVSSSQISGTLLGMGTGMAIGNGATHQEVRDIVNAVLSVMPETQPPPTN